MPPAAEPRISLTLHELESMLDRAAKRAAEETIERAAEAAGEAGARKVLERLGLDDDKAARDVLEMREWMDLMRDLKRKGFGAVITIVVGVILTAIATGALVMMKATK